MNTPQNIISFTGQVYHKLLKDLEVNPAGDEPKANLHAQRIQSIYDSIMKVWTRLSGHSFSEEAEEIDFFKLHLPNLLCLLIYETEKSDLSCVELMASRRLRVELTERRLEYVDLFFKENAEFIRYYYSGSTYLDTAYFLRRSKEHAWDRAIMANGTDPLICPKYTGKIATLLAYSRLLEDLERLLEPGEKVQCGESTEEPGLKQEHQSKE